MHTFELKVLRKNLFLLRAEADIEPTYFIFHPGETMPTKLRSLVLSLDNSSSWVGADRFPGVRIDEGNEEEWDVEFPGNATVCR